MKSTTFFTTLIIGALLLCSCGGGNRQAAAANNEASETAVVETTEIIPIEPAIIDIAGNLENRKEFRLSDFGSSVRYIRLQPPAGMEFTRILNVLSDDDYIIINAAPGLFVYSADGEYLYTVYLNKLEPMGGGGVRVLDGILDNIDLLNGILLYRTFQRPSAAEARIQLNVFDMEKLPDNVQPAFQRELYPDRRSSGRFLLIDGHSYLIIGGLGTPSSTFTAISIQGDTLFNIHNHYQPTTTGNFARSAETIYRINGNLMLQKQYNDTVFALIPPNRIEPAFIMNWGDFKPDMNRLANGGTEEGKFVLRNWVETQRHIFIEYTEGRAFPSRWAEGNVRHHWAIFDKYAQTLTHHYAPTGFPMREFSIPGMFSYQVPSLAFENDIDPVGMPFFPQGVNHRGEMYMVFSKAQVQQQIATGKFNNSRLQALYNRMPEGSFYFMIVK